MEERDLIPEIDPTLGLTDEQVQSRTPAGKPVYSGKSEKEIVLTHCFTFFNLIFVILAVMLIIGGSSPLNMGFLVVAVINTVIGIIQEIRAKRAVERLTLVAERPVAVIRSGTRQEVLPGKPSSRTISPNLPPATPSPPTASYAAGKCGWTSRCSPAKLTQ